MPQNAPTSGQPAQGRPQGQQHPRRGGQGRQQGNQPAATPVTPPNAPQSPAPAAQVSPATPAQGTARVPMPPHSGYTGPAYGHQPQAPVSGMPAYGGFPQQGYYGAPYGYVQQPVFPPQVFCFRCGAQVLNVSPQGIAQCTNCGNVMNLASHPMPQQPYGHAGMGLPMMQQGVAPTSAMPAQVSALPASAPVAEPSLEEISRRQADREKKVKRQSIIALVLAILSITCCGCFAALSGWLYALLAVTSLISLGICVSTSRFAKRHRIEEGWKTMTYCAAGVASASMIIWLIAVILMVFYGAISDMENCKLGISNC